MSRSSVLVLLVLAGLVGLSSWWLMRLDAVFSAPSINTNHLPQLSLNQLTLTRYNTKGIRLDILSASYLEQLAGEQGMRASQLQLQLFDQAGLHLAWQGRADRAHLSQNSEQLDLNGQVVLKQFDLHNVQQMQIDTDQVQLFERGERIIAASKVLMTSTDGQLTGIGLNALPKQGIYTLQQDVRGKYAVSK